MTTRSWQFFRAGGFDQVRLSTGADLVNIGELDQKLWVALACPVKGLEFDARTLDLLDVDRDSRIRAPELIAAAKWVGTVLKNPDDLLKGSTELPLSAIDESREEGQRLLAAAKAVLAGVGKPNAQAISVAEAAEAIKTFDGLAFNGDGVVPAESAADDGTRAIVKDLMACMGAERDRSGKDGFTREKFEAFQKALEAHASWLAKAEADPAAMPLKGETSAAHQALVAVWSKIDDFFARCRLAAFDGRAVAALNREEKEYLAVAAKDLSITSSEVAGFPLARVAADATLPLDKGLNPAWAEPMAAFVAKVVKPLLGELKVLTEAQWKDLVGRFAAFEKWQASKQGEAVEKLGAARVRELMAPDARKRLEALLAKELEQQPNAQSLGSVEKLVLYHRDLFRLANNFVSFRDFYERKSRAVFQVGTLFLDQRSCELCVRVDDTGRHATMAPLARAYLAYCDCTRPATGEKMTIAAAFTAGDSDNLMVGRNGIFYDRQGRDWDATITKIVDNPISVRQAFWAPYKKLVRFVEEQAAKRAAAGESAAGERLTSAAKGVEKSAETGKAEAAPKKIDIGTVAALGVAVGGITAAIGVMMEAFFGLGLWMPVGLVALLLGISGPSMFIAWLKLRQRNLGPLLDANGWAVNSAARLNVPFGGSLTKVAALPPGSRRDLSDPFAEKSRPWGVWAAVLLLVVLLGTWYLGKLDRFLPSAARSVEVLGDMAPARVSPPTTQPAAAPAPAPTPAPAPAKPAGEPKAEAPPPPGG